jgi:hypothetical protein
LSHMALNTSIGSAPNLVEAGGNWIVVVVLDLPETAADV